jgi:hypothetical protein
VLRRCEGLLDRHGTRAVFIARLLPLARTFVSLPAGARRVRLVPFIALTTIGCAAEPEYLNRWVRPGPVRVRASGAPMKRTSRRRQVLNPAETTRNREYRGAVRRVQRPPHFQGFPGSSWPSYPSRNRGVSGSILRGE